MSYIVQFVMARQGFHNQRFAGPNNFLFAMFAH